MILLVILYLYNIIISNIFIHIDYVLKGETNLLFAVYVSDKWNTETPNTIAEPEICGRVVCFSLKYKINTNCRFNYFMDTFLVR